MVCSDTAVPEIRTIYRVHRFILFAYENGSWQIQMATTMTTTTTIIYLLIFYK